MPEGGVDEPVELYPQAYAPSQTRGSLLCHPLNLLSSNRPRRSIERSNQNGLSISAFLTPARESTVISPRIASPGHKNVPERDTLCPRT